MNNIIEQFEELKTVRSCIEWRENLLQSEQIQKLKTQLETVTDKAEKQALGKELNILKKQIVEASNFRIEQLQTERSKDKYIDFDVTFESEIYKNTASGRLHPITTAANEIVTIFQKMGFGVFDNHQIESQWNNFTAVGTPDYHTARTMQDTFFVDLRDENDESYVMRTQVTANLATYAISNRPPFRVVFPGLTFRAEKIDATHDINFHQLDMWLVDRQVSIAQLVTLIKKAFGEYFAKPDLQIRIRPSYFPFTQPSFEIDIFCDWFKDGKWVEVAGAGPIDRQVLKNIGLDDQEWQGLAFGFGLTRLTQLKLQLLGLAQFYNGDLDFLKV